MHEVGITQSIIEIAEQHARRENAGRIASVTVEIGSLSGVVPESVEFCFEACSSGTLAEGASLIIKRIQGRGRCSDCETEFDLDTYTFACPECDGFAVERLCGEELRISEMEID